jgi:prepilin-type N-terminal cleavage/methylation domain-containing protein
MPSNPPIKFCARFGLISPRNSAIAVFIQKMLFSPPFNHGRASKRLRAAFTLTELLVVLAVVALLVCLRLPALARVKTQTWITQCSGNLRQVGMSFLLYGNDNGCQIYSSSVGNWPWDMADGVYQSFVHYTGGSTNAFYCPSNPYQNSVWLYGAPIFHVTGYAYTYPGVGTGYNSFSGFFSTNINANVTPQQQPTRAGPGMPSSFVVPSASTRVLVADAEICQGSVYNPALPVTNYNFTDIAGGAPAFPDGRHHRASHLADSVPLGGNASYLDGHLEWHALRSASYNMIQRNNSTGEPPGEPCFLW